MRRRAREFAFRVLFEAEQGGAYVPDVLEHALADEGRRGLERSRRRSADDEDAPDPLDAEALAFARRLALGYDDKRYEVDDTLKRVIEGWTFPQMAKTDLAVLRLSAFEMMFEPTPRPAVIEIAVRLAKKYGGEESGRFVNGVLARLKRFLEEGGEAPTR